MKVKEIRTGVKNLENMICDAKDFFVRYEKGEKMNKQVGIYFATEEAMKKALTKERMKILRTLKHGDFHSISELAKFLKRDQKNVWNDVNALVNKGFIKLKEADSKKKTYIPQVLYDKIIMEIDL